MTERWGGGADEHCHFHAMKTILDDGDLRKSFLYLYCTSFHDVKGPEIKHELGSASNGQRADYL